jgi:hypothetical protein
MPICIVHDSQKLCTFLDQLDPETLKSGQRSVIM